MKYKVGNILVINDKCSFHRLFKDELVKVIDITPSDKYHVITCNNKFRATPIDQVIYDIHIKGCWIPSLNSNIKVL
jgi:hypothetical protein